MTRRQILGLDLGQRRDPTALALVERVSTEDNGRPAESTLPCNVQEFIFQMHARRLEMEARAARDVFQLRLLERLPLGLSYPEIVASVVDLTWEVAKEGKCQLVVDGTGVGAPVTDLLRRALLDRFGSTDGLSQLIFTGGYTVHEEGERIFVPRNDLVTTIEVLLECKRLVIASDLPLASELVEELENIHRRILPPTGKESFVPWREKCHDDLVFALAVALWWGHYTGGPG